jgi:GNAT superfamily N-acetyltransferase
MTALSAIDTSRFGVRVAKSAPSSPQEWRAALDFCAREAVELLIARIDASDLALARRIETDGARLTDGLVRFRSTRLAPGAKGGGALPVRTANPAEAPLVRDLARRSFAGYMGHYHADLRLDRAACDETYADWAYRACADPAVADAVLVAEDAGKLVGFGALRMTAPDEADGMLFGVDPVARGRGVYRALLEAFIAWSAQRGARSATYSTQLANAAAQRAIARAGFEPDRTFLTFHKWFER